MTGEDRTWLQRRPFRSVSLEREANGAPVVVKRFHHSGLRALLDRRRARREFHVLRALEGQLPVPRAREVRRGAEGWELRLEALPAARSLEELLAGDRPACGPPGGWPRLARQLGALLANLSASGWRHGDPTLRNVLVDGAGRAWIVDWARAERCAPAADQAWRLLVRAAAQVREHWSAALERRALRSWWAALPDTLRPAGDPPEVARRLEREARHERRRQVVAGLGRWLRESSRVRVEPWPEGRVLVRRELAAQEVEARASPLPADALAGHDGTVLVRATPVELRARWLLAARLHEHGIPVNAPRALCLAGRASWAAFAPGGRAPTVRALEALLRDRGLELVSPVLLTDEAGVRVAEARAVVERPG